MQDNAVGNGIKCFIKTHKDNILSLPLFYSAAHLVIEGDRATQAGPALHKSVLAASDCSIVLYVPRGALQPWQEIVLQF